MVSNLLLFRIFGILIHWSNIKLNVSCYYFRISRRGVFHGKSQVRIQIIAHIFFGNGVMKNTVRIVQTRMVGIGTIGGWNFMPIRIIKTSCN